MIQVQQWRLWVGLWLNRNLERDPELAAGVLSKLFPLWIQCTNSARDALRSVAMSTAAASSATVITFPHPPTQAHHPSQP